MASLPTSTHVINGAPAEYAAEWLCDAVWDENGMYQAGIWSTAQNNPATFRVVAVSAGNEDVLIIHLISLANDKIKVAFHAKRDGVDEHIDYILALLCRQFPMDEEQSSPAAVVQPKGLSQPQRRRKSNIIKAHDLRAENRDITRQELALTLGVTVRTVDSYLKAPCNRRNCAFCT